MCGLQEENRKVAKITKDKRSKEYLDDAKKLETDNAQFAAYAHSVIDEWGAAGRDTRLLARTVDKMKPHAPREHAGKKKVDTFERLGFSVRWLEEPSYPSYPGHPS
jgi:hypothetical protein